MRLQVLVMNESPIVFASEILREEHLLERIARGEANVRVHAPRWAQQRALEALARGFLQIDLLRGTGSQVLLVELMRLRASEGG